MRNFIGILVALITMVVPVWIAWETFQLGGKPVKSVLLSKIGPMEAISDLKEFPENIEVDLTINGEQYEKLTTFSIGLENAAKAPILPEEFYKPMALKVKAPWEIIGVSKSFGLRYIDLEWDRISPQKMEAKPFLMNSGDAIRFTVYVAVKEDIDQQPELEINTRIVALKDFTKKKSILDVARKSPAIVYLSLLDVLSLLIVAGLLFLWYYLNLVKIGWIKGKDNLSLLSATCAAMLSFSVAEVIVYYLSGGEPIRESILGRNFLNWEYQIQNWLILCAHCAVSVYFYKRTKRKAGAA